MEHLTTSAHGRRIAVEIDHSVCSGTGHCAHLVPGVFRVVDGKSWIPDDVDIDQANPDDLRSAESGCPWFAIEVTASTE